MISVRVEPGNWRHAYKRARTRSTRCLFGSLAPTATFVVIDESGFHTQSDAALRVGATLKKPALNVMAGAFTKVPSPLRE